MIGLREFVAPVADFQALAVPRKLEILAWFLHTVGRHDRITSGQLLECFEELHLPRPANVASSLSKLCARKPPRFIRDKDGYRLSAFARKELGQLVPVRSSAVEASRLLTELLTRMSDPIKKAFLQETLVCYANAAYRAAVVMAWNLAFSDVLDRILTAHLQAFNSQVGSNGFKRPIAQLSDFADLKESQIIRIARASGIISKESTKILEEKLNKRNTAAHPSGVVVSVATAEEVIFDLVENIILKESL